MGIMLLDAYREAVGAFRDAIEGRSSVVADALAPSDVREIERHMADISRNPSAYYRFHHDFETFCEADLPDVGSDAYSRHPSCEVLMMGFCVSSGPIGQWVPAEERREPTRKGQYKIPSGILDHMRNPKAIKFAWNKPFEWAIWKNVLGLETKHEHWRDPMVMAYTLSLPGSLDKAGPVVDLPEDMRKQKRGTSLITKFSKPRKPTKKDPRTRNMWFDLPSDWEDYKEYNRVDVLAERGIYLRMKPFDMSDHEWTLWVIDQQINQAGIPINMKLVKNAISIYEGLVEEDTNEMQAITGLDNPNSTKQLLPWLQDHGYPFTDLKKGHVVRAIERLKEELPGVNDPERFDRMQQGIRALELRLNLAKASPKKFYALERASEIDETGERAVLRNSFQFAGAGRTWRWAGRIFQAHNLPKPATKFLEKNVATVIEDVEQYPAPVIKLIYELADQDPYDVLTASIRPCAQAEPGFVFIDADLNAIENRVLGWMADCRKILKVFEDNLDPYLAFGTYMFGKTYDQLEYEYKVLKDGKRRTIAKPGVLGCFGPDTPVLTDKGWKRIVDVSHGDKVHDGNSFVEHEGVINRGRREVLDRFGIHVTPDHRILVGDEWVEACQLDDRPKGWKQARAMANGLLSGLPEHLAVAAVNMSAGAYADAFGRSREQTCFSENQLDAIPALRKIVAAKSENVSVLPCSTFSQIVSTLRGLGAKIPTTPLMNIMGAGEFACGSRRPTNGLSASRNLARTEVSNATEETTMATTSRATCGSQHDQNKTLTSETWDILNAGPNSRFVVLTDAGPLVVHNCGYMLGAGQRWFNNDTGEYEATGLLGYAWNMGIKEFTLEDSKLSVETFRREFEEVKDMWYDLERAAKRCVRTAQPTEYRMLRFEMHPPFLKMVLPSGRALHYCRPRLEMVDTPWGEKKEGLTYEGLDKNNNWNRISTHGGKITENADQAMARDLLANAMYLAKLRYNMDLRIHVHDQAVAQVRIALAERELERLQECLGEQPRWAPGLPLGSAGFVSPIFVKD